jgi:hypothetical protein
VKTTTTKRQQNKKKTETADRKATEAKTTKTRLSKPCHHVATGQHDAAMVSRSYLFSVVDLYDATLWSIFWVLTMVLTNLYRSMVFFFCPFHEMQQRRTKVGRQDNQKTRQDESKAKTMTKTRQDKTTTIQPQDNEKTRQDKTRQGRARRDKTIRRQ